MNKAKAKDFWEKNKGKITIVGGIAVGAALVAVGYKCGIITSAIGTIKNTVAFDPITLKDLLGDGESAKETFKRLGKNGNDLVYGMTYWFTDISKT